MHLTRPVRGATCYAVGQARVFSGASRGLPSRSAFANRLSVAHFGGLDDVALRFGRQRCVPGCSAGHGRPPREGLVHGLGAVQDRFLKPALMSQRAPSIPWAKGRYRGQSHENGNETPIYTGSVDVLEPTGMARRYNPGPWTPN